MRITEFNFSGKSKSIKVVNKKNPQSKLWIPVFKYNSGYFVGVSFAPDLSHFIVQDFLQQLFLLHFVFLFILVLSSNKLTLLSSFELTTFEGLKAKPKPTNPVINEIINNFFILLFFSLK